MKLKLTLFLALLLAPLAGLHAADAPAVAPDQTVHRVAVRFHLVTDLAMTKKGVAMTNWLTPAMIAQTVMPEVNRIWAAAKIEWTLSGVSPATTRSGNRAEVIAYLLQATRDGEGQGDPERIRKLQSLLSLANEDTRVVNLYVIPYLGGTSQGNATPRQKRVLLGQWTDKPSRGVRPPEKCLLVETGEFRQGSFSRTVAHELGHILGLPHPARNAAPFNRLMGGSRPGNDLTTDEVATARKAAMALGSVSRQP